MLILYEKGHTSSSQQQPANVLEPVSCHVAPTRQQSVRGAQGSIHPDTAAKGSPSSSTTTKIIRPKTRLKKATGHFSLPTHFAEASVRNTWHLLCSSLSSSKNGMKKLQRRRRRGTPSFPPFSSVSFSCPLPSVGATTGCWQYFNIGSIIVRIDRLEGTTLGDDANWIHPFFTPSLPGGFFPILGRQCHTRQFVLTNFWKFSFPFSTWKIPAAFHFSSIQII